MRDRFSGPMVAVAIAAVAVSAAISVPLSRTSAQAPAASGTALKTPWGEPDLQGIWTDEFDTPLQRPAKYANQEFFTPAQREELDQQRRAHFGSDPRQERGTAIDVGGAYNTAFLTVKHAGPRTSLIVDPPNGRIPPQTPQAQQAAAADREFRLALLQSTDACKNKAPACAGGKYDPTPSPRFAELPPRYHAATSRVSIAAMVRRTTALADRCLHSGLPEFGSLFGGSYPPDRADPRRHLDVLRREPRPRLAAQHRHERQPPLAGQHPPMVRRLARPLGGRHAGDRRDQFQPENRFPGIAREPASGRALDAAPGRRPSSTRSRSRIRPCGRRPWTVKQEFTRQSDEENRIYYEPRCIEGNYGLPGLLHGRRAEERAFAEGRGPDPRTLDNVGGVESVQLDPLR